MKMKITISLFFIFTILFVNSVNSQENNKKDSNNYPYIEVLPTTPTTENDISVILILRTDCCNPDYKKSFKISNDTIALFYKEGDPCFCAMIYPPAVVKVGPMYDLGILKANTYTVTANGKTVGSLTVIKQTTPNLNDKFTIKGYVMNDPFPLKMLSRPIPNATVYLYDTIPYANNNLKTLPPQLILPSPKDSFITQNDGSFILKDIEIGTWTLTTKAKGYNTSSIFVNLHDDTNMTISLLKEGSMSTVKGSVLNMKNEPVPQCTVSVLFKKCADNIDPANNLIGNNNVLNISTLSSCKKYVTITDKKGLYTIDSLPLTRNNEQIFITTQKNDYLPMIELDSVRNTITTIVDFKLEELDLNVDSVQSKGIVYTIKTDKKTYSYGDSVNIYYSIYNNTEEKLTFDVSSSCKYTFSIKNSKDSVIYDYMNNRMCTTDIFKFTVNPWDSVSTKFQPFIIETKDSNITVSASIFGYEATKAITNIIVNHNQINVNSKIRKQFINRINITAKGQLSIRLNSAQKLSVSIFSLNGKLLIKPIINKMAVKGNNTFNLNLTNMQNKTLIVKIDGNTFTKTKMFNTIRK